MPRHSNSIVKHFTNVFLSLSEDVMAKENAKERVQKPEPDLPAKDPSSPRQGCPINNLPNELLAHIFWLGFIDDGKESEDEDDWEDSDISDNDDLDDLPPPTNPSIIRTNVRLEDLLAGRTGVEDGVSLSFGGVEERHSCEECGEDHDTMSSVDESDKNSFGSDGDDGEYTLPFQVLVSHVCRHWRNVALESPALWTLIDFREGAPYERSRIMLQRSKNLPLTIEINCDMTTVSPRGDNQHAEYDEDGERLLHSLDDVNTMIDILTPHLDRWHHLEIMVQYYSYMHRFLQRFSQFSGAPNLEVLQLNHYEENEDRSRFLPEELNEHFDIFQGNTPKLSSISLWGVHIKWPVLCLKQACAHDSCPRGILSNVKDLELAYHTFDVRPSYDAFASYLRSSTQLHTLSLCQSGPAGTRSDWPSIHESTIELPSVRELVLMYQECDYVCALLDRLVLPNLESLAIDFDEEDYSALARHLSGSAAGDRHGRSLLSRLSRLKIAGFNTDENGIDLIYGQLDHLQALNLDLDSLEWPWFSKLTTPRPNTNSSSASSSPSPTLSAAASSSQLYLPSMDTFTITGVTGSDIRKFAEMRKEKGIPLKKVFASDDTRVFKHDLNWLKDNVDFEYFEPSDSEDFVDVTDGESLDSDSESMNSF